MTQSLNAFHEREWIVLTHFLTRIQTFSFIWKIWWLVPIIPTKMQNKITILRKRSQKARNKHKLWLKNKLVTEIPQNWPQPSPIWPMVPGIWSLDNKGALTLKKICAEKSVGCGSLDSKRPPFYTKLLLDANQRYNKLPTQQVTLSFFVWFFPYCDFFSWTNPRQRLLLMHGVL